MRGMAEALVELAKSFKSFSSKISPILLADMLSNSHNLLLKFRPLSNPLPKGERTSITFTTFSFSQRKNPPKRVFKIPLKLNQMRDSAYISK